MPKLIERIQSAYKAFWGSGNWIDSSHYPYSSSRFAYTPGTNIDYARAIGDIRSNPIVQACLNKIMLAWPESYPCVKEIADKKKIEVEGHPLAAVLSSPSRTFAYDDTVLWGATIRDFFPYGNAYWGINRERETNFVGEFVPIPENVIRPKRNNNSRNPGPDFFEVSQNGRTEKHPVEDVIHFRFGVNPYDDLLGVAFPASGIKELYTDSEAGNYINTNLRNGGAAWAVLSPKEKDAYFQNPQEVKDKFEANTSGDNKHRAVVLDGATDITFPPSMKDTGPDALRRRPEAMICALFCLPPMWVGVPAGLERSTYSNMEEAARDAWLTIVAVQRMLGRQLTQQVLRRPGNFPAKWQADRYFAGFDYSEVRALQPNKVEEWKRFGEMHSVHHCLTKDEVREEIGYDKLTAEQRTELEPPEPTETPAGGTQKPRNGKAYEELRERVAVQAAANVEAFEKLFGTVESEEEWQEKIPVMLSARNGSSEH